MMKRIDVVREQMGIGTVFDVLRPLTNPAHAAYEILGVSEAHLVEPMAHVLAALGVRHGMVVYGRDGSDESRRQRRRRFVNLRRVLFETYEVRPEDFTLPVAARQELEGGVPKDNASSRGAFLMGKRAEPGRPFYSMPVLASILAVRLLILPPVSAKRPESSTAAQPVRNWTISSS